MGLLPKGRCRAEPAKNLPVHVTTQHCGRLQNDCVPSSKYGFRSLRTSSNLFITNLAVADLLMSSVDFPLFVASSYSSRWIFGSTVCLMYGATTGVAGLVTINTLAAISLDRFTAVVTRLNPRHGLSKTKTIICIVLIWAYSGAWACAPLFGWSKYMLERIGTTCTFDYLTQTWKNRSFVLSILVGNFVLPLSIIIYSYTRILTAMASIRRGLQSHSAEISIGTRRQRYFFKAEVKTTIIVIVIILFFCLSWMPYVIVALIGLFGDQSVITPLTAVIPSIVAKTSTVSNPILYSISHPKVRKRIKRLFSSVFRQGSLRNSNNSPSPSQEVPQFFL
ncbi:rhodopsin, GQ-coupled-like [Haliotis asinina]|uniref:rhodopsin, GQ-coupled-like n=1 Tax=Haliotis asinina TaxID=109174 RepID=UPI003532463E